MDLDIVTTAPPSPPLFLLRLKRRGGASDAAGPWRALHYCGGFAFEGLFIPSMQTLGGHIWYSTNACKGFQFLKEQTTFSSIFPGITPQRQRTETLRWLKCWLFHRQWEGIVKVLGRQLKELWMKSEINLNVRKMMEEVCGIRMRTKVMLVSKQDPDGWESYISWRMAVLHVRTTWIQQYRIRDRSIFFFFYHIFSVCMLYDAELKLGFLEIWD